MNDALIVIDVQNDLILKEGKTPIVNAHKIIKPINRLINWVRKGQGLVVFTQDWHPQEHKSFASNHEGKKIFDIIKLGKEAQVLGLLEAEAAQLGDGAQFLALVLGQVGLGGVFDDRQLVLLGDGVDLIHVTRHAVDVDRHDGAACAR
jgi:nicotinamidase-related amidase